MPACPCYKSNTVELATELTIAWLGNPNTRIAPDDVPAFLQSMHHAVTRPATPAAVPAPEEVQDHEPAVSVRKSLASRVATPASDASCGGRQ